MSTTRRITDYAVRSRLESALRRVGALDDAAFEVVSAFADVSVLSDTQETWTVYTEPAIAALDALPGGVGYEVAAEALARVQVPR